MIVPTKNMTIRFTDDKISRILRVGIDRDILHTMHDHIIVMNDVPFGIANRILNVTNIDVNLLKDPEEDWIKVACCDENTLKDIYNGKICSKIEILASSNEIIEKSNVEEVSENDEIVENSESTDLELEEIDNTSSEVEESTDEVVDEIDDSNDEVVSCDDVIDTDENTDSIEEVDDSPEGNDIVEEEKTENPVQNIKPVENVRRQVNINNNRHRKHH